VKDGVTRPQQFFVRNLVDTTMALNTASAVNLDCMRLHFVYHFLLN
jgi:hypothetical protein